MDFYHWINISQTFPFLDSRPPLIFIFNIFFSFEAELCLCNHCGIKEAHFELHIKNLWV